MGGGDQTRRQGQPAGEGTLPRPTLTPAPGLPRPLPPHAQAVLGTMGVRAEHTTTNHIMEVQQYLGIGERLPAVGFDA